MSIKINNTKPVIDNGELINLKNEIKSLKDSFTNITNNMDIIVDLNRELLLLKETVNTLKQDSVKYITEDKIKCLPTVDHIQDLKKIVVKIQTELSNLTVEEE